MNEVQNNLIPIDIPKTDFARFFGDGKNRRIFFSGRFGIGKTFFLGKFFEEHESEYDVYHLFPVRYQISSNENIIDLLKYDILVELLKKYPDAFSEEKIQGTKNWFKLFAAFCKDKGLFSVENLLVEGTQNILKLIPDPLSQTLAQLGRPLGDILTIAKEFAVFKKQYVSKYKVAVESFLKDMEQINGSAAVDYVGQLLHQSISTLKSDKKSVLILDDFDRIDPEHIFRILNVLSVHLEGSEGNKFGFDQIVIVGDIRNIKSIFHHRYGNAADFWGYFDKFFTIKPYEFDNKKAIAESIPILLRQIQCEEPKLKEAINVDGGITKLLLSEVLGRAFAIEEMNLRHLYRPIINQFQELMKGCYYSDPFVDTRNQCIDIGIKVLIAIYGGESHFLSVLKKMHSKTSVTDKKSGHLYKEFSASMLKYMVELAVGEKCAWLKAYTLERGPSGIHLTNKDQYSSYYFYGTLMEYITQGKYIKQDRMGYDR